MPNLVITNGCNLDCPYCFATEYRAAAPSGVAHLTEADFDRLVAFMGVDEIRFCGGEPTLHPRFVELLHRALADPARRAFVMTNGLWPEAVRAAMKAAPLEITARVRYLVNFLRPSASLDATLAILDPRQVTLGVTLFDADATLAPLFEAARRFGIRQIRYSVAAPTLTEPRSWRLDVERDFPNLARAVIDLVSIARTRGLSVQSDCGYIPPCFFTPRQLEDLRDATGGADAELFKCHGPVDIDPSGLAWRCFGLYALHQAETRDFTSARQLTDDFEERTRSLAALPLRDACDDCPQKNTTCGGGCYAFRVVRDMERRADAAGVGLDDARLGEAHARWHPRDLHLVGSTGRWMLREDGEWAEPHLDPTERQVLLACADGVRVRAIGGAGVHRAIRRLYALGAIELS